MLLLGVRALVWIFYAYVIVTEVVLTLGFLLLLFGANPDASFVAWVYRSLDRAMEPFRGMFTPIHLNVSASTDVQAVLDTSVLFAMVVYAFAGLAVHALLEWLSSLLRRFDEQERQREAAAAYEAARAAQTAPVAWGPPVGAPPTAGPPPSPPPSVPPPSAPPSAPAGRRAAP
ncbi:hypothetical protein JCM18899A_31950 [Nocardioides sp. AN3]